MGTISLVRAHACRLAARPLAARPFAAHPLRHHQRACAALDAFAQTMQRGLGLGWRLRTHAEPIAEALHERGWCALDAVLDDAAAARVRAECADLYRDGRYTPSYSRVAETGEKIWRPGVHMMELDSESWRSAPTLVIYLSELMGALPGVVNRGFDDRAGQHPQISDTTFGHKLAVSTDDGSKYPKHLDNVTGGEDKRRLTAVYYANPGWDVEAQGGAIRIWDSLAPPVHTDVAPVGTGGADRLLLFWSDVMVHEVLPMYVPGGGGGSDADLHHRHTFTIWLTTDNDASLLDGLSPLWPLRIAHYPDKE
eukprot:7027173-Prymnesium_polylepis.1